MASARSSSQAIMNSLRVLHLIDGLGTGGSERSLAEMLPPLRAAGVDTTVVCLHRRAQGVQQSVVDAGFDVRFLPGGGTLRRALNLRRVLRELRPDLVHTTHFESDLAGRLAAAGGPPVLTSLVNLRYGAVRRRDPRVRPWRLRLVRTADGWTARHLTTHFHAVSAAVAEEAVACLGVPAERVTVIPRGRDPERFRFDRAAARLQVRRELGLAAEVPVLLNVGRHEYQKGQADLLRTAARLRDAGSPAVLLVAGREGNATPDLTRLHRALGLGGRVRLLGHRADVPALMAAADLFVLPSLYEGSPGALIEAMAMGLPVVASDIAPVVEVVGDGESAVLVPTEDSAALATAAAGLLADRECAASLGRRGTEIFSHRFTLDHTVSGMADLYRRIVARSRP